uniref:Uncharacterized protein n=1 Tax=Oryza sativa subsp. japonica TaxID=39947 RepID=Q6UU49_ORYSJ|nr:hypothetical protein OSJNBa0079E14.15 [Oryza sativa Japonica Group]
MWRSCLHMPHFNYLPKAGQRQPRHARWAQPGWHEAGTAAAGEGATRFRRPPTTVSDVRRSEGERRSMATMAELGLQVARSKERGRPEERGLTEGWRNNEDQCYGGGAYKKVKHAHKGAEGRGGWCSDGGWDARGMRGSSRAATGQERRRSVGLGAMMATVQQLTAAARARGSRARQHDGDGSRRAAMATSAWGSRRLGPRGRGGAGLWNHIEHLDHNE